MDPDGFADLVALGRSGRLPPDAPLCSSPEPKALAMAHVLAHPDPGLDPATAHRCGCDRVDVVPELAEHRREARWLHGPRASYQRI